MAMRIWYVYWNVWLVKKQNELKDIPVQSRAVQEVVSRVVCHQRICAILKQQVDNGKIALLRRP